MSLRSKNLLKYLTVRMVMLAILFRMFFAAAISAYAQDSTAVSLSVADTAANAGRVKSLAQNLYNGNNFASQNGGYNYISGNQYPSGSLFSWDSESKNNPKYRSWTYYNGIMMDAFLMIDSASFEQNVISFYDANIKNGQVDNSRLTSSNYNKNRYAENELDSVPPARALFDLIKSGSVSDSQKSNYKQMVYYVYSILESFPKADGTNGAIYKHKYNNSNWNTFQVGLDGLYMAQPFLMEVANCLDSGSNLLDSSQYPASADLYASVYNSMIWVRNNMYNESLGLYHHGWGPSVGGNGHYWLRGIGWYAAALAEVSV